MFRGFSLLLLVLVACGGKAETSQVQEAGSACADLPMPAHHCGRRVSAPSCNVVDGEALWQIDCVPRGPADPIDTRPVTSCAATDCGVEPAWDPRDCVHGFGDLAARCERVGSAACAWRRSCRSKPCSPDDEGSCDVARRERLGRSCRTMDCPAGYRCATVLADVDRVNDPVCVPQPECDAITCAAGKTCAVLEGAPLQIVCVDP